MMTGEEAYLLIAPRVNKYLKRLSFGRKKGKKTVQQDLSSTISTFSPTTTTSISTSFTPPVLRNERIVSFDGNSPTTEINFDMKKKIEITETKKLLFDKKINGDTKNCSDNEYVNNLRSGGAIKLNASKGTPSGLLPHMTDDAMGGTIPAVGFRLRLVTGGYLSGDGCSRCPWLARCQGCVVPNDSSMVSKCKGELER